MECQSKWNDIGKELYKQSAARFFRKPKQCRERWRNYLDPQVQKYVYKDSEANGMRVTIGPC